MKTKLYWVLASLGLAAFAFAVHRVNERRFRALEQDVRVAREQARTLSRVAGRAEPQILAAAQAYRSGSLGPAPREPATGVQDAPEAKSDEPRPVPSTEDQAAYVDSVFAQETSDRGWSIDAARTIGDGLRAQIGNSRIESLECRTTLCKARLSHDDPAKFSDFIDRVVANSVQIWKGPLVSHRDPVGADGVVRNTIYFGKEGTDIPILE